MLGQPEPHAGRLLLEAPCIYCKQLPGPQMFAKRWLFLAVFRFFGHELMYFGVQVDVMIADSEGTVLSRLAGSAGQPSTAVGYVLGALSPQAKKVCRSVIVHETWSFA